MSSLYPRLRPILFSLDPERAHALALSSARFAHRLRLLQPPAPDPDAAVTLLGLRFPNRVGLAAGFDKNAACIDPLGALGFGFVEVGTVTPLPQAGQARPRLFRLPEAQALINRMGFPNEGAQLVARRLAARTFPGVCGVNIGKNAATPVDEAIGDYLECFRALAPYADYVAINVSSPNTKDLRRLQGAEFLRPILDALLAERARLTRQRSCALLVKIAPDLDDEDLAAFGRLIRTSGIDGVIATNTTVTRPGVADLAAARETGGLSGAPLRQLSLRAVRILRSVLDPTTPIIAVGGIASGEDAIEALAAGADLVQVYSGLVYRGPALVGEILATLSGGAPSAAPRERSIAG